MKSNKQHLNQKQEEILQTLTEITNYHHNTLSSHINPEDVFKHFVNTYIYIDKDSKPIGYKDINGASVNDFEKTLFFNHVCAYLRNKTDKSYIIDQRITPCFMMLSIPYRINHFDPRIYNYISK
jgi:hypothetical protein